MRRRSARTSARDGEAKEGTAADPNIHKRIQRKFDGRVVFGTIDGFDEDEFLYHVTYDDGDDEDFAVDEIDDFIVGDAEEAAAKQKPKPKPKARGSARKGGEGGKGAVAGGRPRARKTRSQVVLSETSEDEDDVFTEDDDDEEEEEEEEEQEEEEQEQEEEAGKRRTRGRGLGRQAPPPRRPLPSRRERRRERAAAPPPPPRPVSDDDDDDDARTFSIIPPPKPKEREPSPESSEEEVEEAWDAEVVAQLPPQDATVAFGNDTFPVSEAALGDVVAAYNVLRAFSWSLKLSPFTFQELVAAVVAPRATNLMDEVHVCLLRSLAAHEDRAMRSQRRLDLAYLDGVTWPEYLWEWAATCGDHDFMRHRFTSARPAPDAAADAGADEPAGLVLTSTAGMPPVPRAPSAALAGEDGKLRWPRASFPRPPRPEAAEYYLLPAEFKAAVLARLCNEMLDLSAIREEIDRREGLGRWRVRAAGPMHAREDGEDEGEDEGEEDPNFDACVLCKVGGNLICCDACPAAYHKRCMGESQKSIGDGTWLCEECRQGGRGEAGGLRVPALGKDEAGRTIWAAHGSVFACRPPAAGRVKPFRPGRRRRPKPLPNPGLATWAGSGPGAAAVLSGIEEDPALPVALAPESVAPDPGPDPGLLGVDVVERPGKPWERALDYTNRYRNGWGASANASLASYRNRNKKAREKNAREVPPPLPVSRYQWPSRRSRGGRRDEFDEPEEDAGHRVFVAASYVLRAERELWGLLGASWGGEPHLRRRWQGAMRSASDARVVARAVLELEAALDPRALLPAWGAPEGRRMRALGEDGAGRRKPAKAGRPRKDRPAEVEGEKPAPPRPDDKERRKSGRAAAQSTKGKLGRTADSSDAESGDSSDSEPEERPRPGGRLEWENEDGGLCWWRGGRHEVAMGTRTLQRAVVRRAARRGGREEIPGVSYGSVPGARVARSTRVAWRARVEAATCTAQLALQLRFLEAHISWDAIKPPGSGAAAADAAGAACGEVLGRRPVPAAAVKPEDGAEGGGAAAGEEEEGEEEEEFLVGPAPPAPGEPAPRGAAAEPRWVPAAGVPLWAIKSFEERRRREQAAALRAAGSAEPCLCGESYGESPDDPRLWVGCDTCDRWYHGECAGLSPDDLEEMGDDEWACDACREQEDERRERKREKARARYRATAGEKKGGKGRGPKKGGRGVQLYCLCKDDNEDGRFMVGCDSCTDWFHPGCVGFGIEEAQEMETYECPRCMRKKKKSKKGKGGGGRGSGASEVAASLLPRCEVCARLEHAGGVHKPLFPCTGCGLHVHFECTFPPLPSEGAAPAPAPNAGEDTEMAEGAGEGEAAPPDGGGPGEDGAGAAAAAAAAEAHERAVAAALLLRAQAVDGEREAAAAALAAERAVAEALAGDGGTLGAALERRALAADALAESRAAALDAHRGVAAAAAGEAADPGAALAVEHPLPDEWTCEGCAAGEASAALPCELCPWRGGPMKRTAEGAWVHVMCALWIPETSIDGSGVVQGVPDVAERRWTLTCGMCRKKGVGAIMQCRNGSCGAPFHPMCARVEGLPMKASDAGDGFAYEATCRKHAPMHGGIKPRAWGCEMFYGAPGEDDGGAGAGGGGSAGRRKDKGGGGEQAGAASRPSREERQREREAAEAAKARVGRDGGRLARKSTGGAKEEEGRRDAKGAAGGVGRRNGGGGTRELPPIPAKAAKVSAPVLPSFTPTKSGPALAGAAAAQADAALPSLVRDLFKLDEEAVFVHPVDPAEAPGYEIVCPEPMDLSSIRARMRRGEYGSADGRGGLGALRRDVELMCHNCMTYNEDGSAFYELGRAMLEGATALLGDLEARVGGGGRGGRAARRGSAATAEKQEQTATTPSDSGRRGSKRGRSELVDDEPPTSKSKAAKVSAPVLPSFTPTKSGPALAGAAAAQADAALPSLVRDLFKLDEEAVFVHPVDPAEAPGYEIVCPEPMDLSSIRARMRRGEYGSADGRGGLGALRRDVELMCHNCMTYNEDGSAFYELGRAMLEGATALLDDLEARVGGGGRGGRAARRGSAATAEKQEQTATTPSDSGRRGSKRGRSELVDDTTPARGGNRRGSVNPSPRGAQEVSTRSASERRRR